EDGIRDRNVTGVQTCALPISRQGEAYNAGGGRESNCSILEAVHLCEQITGKKMDLEYSSDNRIADHIWWISDLTKFRTHYPKWRSEERRVGKECSGGWASEWI